MIYIGEGKVHLEKWFKSFAEDNNIHVAILRIGSLVGPGMENRITHRLVVNAFNNKKFKIIEAGQIFSYIHLDDIVAGIYSFLEYYNTIQDDVEKNKERKVSKYEIFNIGTDEYYTLMKIGEEIKKAFQEKNIEIEIEIEKKDSGYKNNSINVDKIYNRIKWRPKYMLKDIIRMDIGNQYK